MAETPLYTFSYKEIVEALIKQQSIHEGIWSLYIEFGIAAANFATQLGDVDNRQPPTDNLVPTAFVPVQKIGLIRAKEITNLSVDASVVNPAPKQQTLKAKKRKTDLDK